MMQDFVRIPWQNQSIQSSHVLPVATTASSGSAGLTSTYGSASGQLNTGYSPGPGSKFEAVSRPLDEVMESNSALHLRLVLIALYYMHDEVLFAEMFDNIVFCVTVLHLFMLGRAMAFPMIVLKMILLLAHFLPLLLPPSCTL